MDFPPSLVPLGKKQIPLKRMTATFLMALKGQFIIQQPGGFTQLGEEAALL